MNDTNERAEDFDRTIRHGVETIKIKSDDRERMIRLYCSLSGTCWNLQLRSPLTLANGREGKDFMITTARLSLDDMIALRDSLNDHISGLENN